MHRTRFLAILGGSLGLGLSTSTAHAERVEITATRLTVRAGPRPRQ